MQSHLPSGRHGVNRYQSTGSLDQLKQYRDRRNLISLRIDDDLTEADVIRSYPCTVHVNRRLATSLVIAATDLPSIAMI